MLVECPKCGFSQPKDQYCASCGVDMENFRLRAKPKKDFFANPILLISIVCAVVFLGTMFVIQRHQKQEISRRVEYLKGGPLYSDASDNAPVSPPTNTAANTTVAPPPPPPPPPPPANAATSTAGSATTQQISTMTSAETTAAAKEPVAKQIKFKTYYTLVPNAMLNSIQVEQPIIQFGPVFRMAQVRNAAQVISKTDILETTDLKVEPGSSDVNWLAGERVGDGFIGLQSQMSVHPNEYGGGYRGEIEVLRALPEDASQSITPVSFSGEFQALPGSAVMITMILPRVQPPARSMASTSKFFRFYRTTDFVSKNSEFVMFIVFE